MTGPVDEPLALQHIPETFHNRRSSHVASIENREKFAPYKPLPIRNQVVQANEAG